MCYNAGSNVSMDLGYLELGYLVSQTEDDNEGHTADIVGPTCLHLERGSSKIEAI